MPPFSEQEEKPIHEGFDVALICQNGHIVTAYSQTMPEFNEKFCSKCGSSTLSKCPDCAADIRGKYNSPGVVNMNSLKLPKFCHNCGNAYPWTKSRIDAAKEFTDELDALSLEEKTELKDAIDKMVVDSPSTEVAASKFKKLATKAGKTAGDALYKIVIDITSEVAKKVMGL